MNKYLLRIIVSLLIPCLVVDRVTAVAFTPEITLQSRLSSQPQLFESQALTLVLVGMIMSGSFWHGEQVIMMQQTAAVARAAGSGGRRKNKKPSPSLGPLNMNQLRERISGGQIVKSLEDGQLYVIHQVELAFKSFFIGAQRRIEIKAFPIDKAGLPVRTGSPRTFLVREGDLMPFMDYAAPNVIEGISRNLPPAALEGNKEPRSEKIKSKSPLRVVRKDHERNDSRFEPPLPLEPREPHGIPWNSDTDSQFVIGVPVHLKRFGQGTITDRDRRSVEVTFPTAKLRLALATAGLILLSPETESPQAKGGAGPRSSPQSKTKSPFDPGEMSMAIFSVHNFIPKLIYTFQELTRLAQWLRGHRSTAYTLLHAA